MNNKATNDMTRLTLFNNIVKTFYKKIMLDVILKMPFASSRKSRLFLILMHTYGSIV